MLSFFFFLLVCMLVCTETEWFSYILSEYERRVGKQEKKKEGSGEEIS